MELQPHLLRATLAAINEHGPRARSFLEICDRLEQQLEHTDVIKHVVFVISEFLVDTEQLKHNTFKQMRLTQRGQDVYRILCDDGRQNEIHRAFEGVSEADLVSRLVGVGTAQPGAS